MRQVHLIPIPKRNRILKKRKSKLGRKIFKSARQWEQQSFLPATSASQPPPYYSFAGHLSSSPSGLFYSQLPQSITDLVADYHQIKSEDSASCSVRDIFSPGSQLCLDNKMIPALPADSKLIKSSSPMVLSRSQIQKKARSRIFLKKRVFKITKLPIGGQKTEKMEGKNYGDEKGDEGEEVEASTVSSAASNSLWQANKTTEAAIDDSVSSRRRRLGFLKRNWEWTRRPPLTATATGVRRQAEAILEYLSSRWAPERGIRAALGDTADTSKALRLLLRRGEIKRSGFGGRADPFQYTVLGSEM